LRSHEFLLCTLFCGGLLHIRQSPIPFLTLPGTLADSKQVAEAKCRA